MLNTEQVFDALPYVAEIFEKLEIQSTLAEMRKEVKGENTAEKQNELGEKLILHVVKNIGRCKDSFFPFLAIICECTEEEAKKKSVAETLTALRAIAKDEELMSFFKSAIQ